MADLSSDDIEIRAIKEAYDALKCLDEAGTHRALAWLESKFHEKFTAPKRTIKPGTDHKRVSPTTCRGWPDGTECRNAPGTKWTPYWCDSCDQQRRAHITEQFNKIKGRFGFSAKTGADHEG